jgi:hypothetical protein
MRKTRTFVFYSIKHMMRTTILLLILSSLYQPLRAQETQIDRSRISIMVIPVNAKDSVTGYQEAISVINSALINMGYRNTLDFKTHKETVDKRRMMTQGTARTGELKYYIEQAEADVIIEADIIWSDPPADPRSRQARVKLKAVDKYTGAVYADNAFIQSMQREFPSLAVALNHALTKDGAEQFKQFLGQLDASYQVLLKEGRAVNVKFEMATKSRATWNDRVGEERLSDKLEEYIQQLALAHRYRALGSSAEYMDFTVQVPIIDESGAFVSPNTFLRKKLDAAFYKLGFDVDVSQVNNWVNFTLLKRTTL